MSNTAAAAAPPVQVTEPKEPVKNVKKSEEKKHAKPQEAKKPAKSNFFLKKLIH